MAVTAYDYAKAVERNCALRLDQEQRNELQRLFHVAMEQARTEGYRKAQQDVQGLLT